MTILTLTLFILTFLLFLTGCFAGYVEGGQDYNDSCKLDDKEE